MVARGFLAFLEIALMAFREIEELEVRNLLEHWPGDFKKVFDLGLVPNLQVLMDALCIPYDVDDWM